jgi:hypothetical protein
MDEVKSITLRNGKVIEKPILEPCEKDDELISEGKERVEPVMRISPTPSVIMPTTH